MGWRSWVAHGGVDQSLPNEEVAYGDGSAIVSSSLLRWTGTDLLVTGNVRPTNIWARASTMDIQSLDGTVAFKITDSDVEVSSPITAAANTYDIGTALSPFGSIYGTGLVSINSPVSIFDSGITEGVTVEFDATNNAFTLNYKDLFVPANDWLKLLEKRQRMVVI